MILRLITMFFFLGSIFIANSSEKIVAKADSLFDQQKYTEAYEVYNSVFLEGKVTSSMLLKMAFIKDGLGNYTEALYFLDLYYRMSGDKSVVGKIEELSSEQNLSGYSYTDIDFFRALLNKYRFQAQLILVGLVMLLAVYILRRRTQKETPITATLLQVVTIAALLFINNGGLKDSQGIIAENNTLLRSGPSAGAEPIEIIGKGHKVKILERTPVWTKIEWSGDEVYIRNGKIKLI